MEQSLGALQGCMPDSRHHPYRPTPDPRTGELKVDPEIELICKKFNLNIGFYYSAQKRRE